MTTPLTLTRSLTGADVEPQPEPQPAAARDITVKTGPDLARVQVSCPHQSGLIYVVPSERSWVCTDELRPAHALAGFFREMIALDDPRVADLMQQWGIYYRSLPLDADGADRGGGAPDG